MTEQLESTDARRDRELVEVAYALEPRVIERARRVRSAIEMLRAGMSPKDVRATVRQRFDLSPQMAWLVVEAAIDLGVPAS